MLHEPHDVTEHALQRYTRPALCLAVLDIAEGLQRQLKAQTPAVKKNTQKRTRRSRVSIQLGQKR